MSFSDSYAKGFNAGYGTVTAVTEGKRKADERIAKESSEKKMLELFRQHNGNLSKIDPGRDINSIEDFRALASIAKQFSSTEEVKAAQMKITEARAKDAYQKLRGGLAIAEEALRAGDLDRAMSAYEYMGEVAPVGLKVERTGDGRLAIKKSDLSIGGYKLVKEGSAQEIHQMFTQLLMNEPQVVDQMAKESYAEQQENIEVAMDPSRVLFDEEGNPYIPQHGLLSGGLTFLDGRQPNRFADTSGKTLLPWDKRMDARQESRREDEHQYAKSQRPKQDRLTDLKLQAAERDLETGGIAPTNNAKKEQEYLGIVTQTSDPNRVFMAAKNYGYLQKVEDDIGATSGYFAPIPGGRIIFDAEGNYVRAEGGSPQQGGQQPTSAGAGTRPAPRGVQDGTTFRDKQSGTKYYVKGGMAYPMD